MNKFIKEGIMKEKSTSFKEKLIEIKNKATPFLKKHKVKLIWIGSALILLLAIIIGCAVYLNDYYHVDGKALMEYTSQAAGNAQFTIDEDGLIIAIPDEVKAGFIFYPGGKVEHSAYLPLMLSLAERGILCVLTPMPFNLAVLDVNAADGIAEQFPEVTEWYIGGHSLGGSMAASYLAKNADEIEGLILLGSYSTADLTGSRVLSIYGSEDGVMNREKYEKYKSNLPGDFTEIVIEGGNHACFGLYGEQDGDGKATITATEQIEATAEYIAKFILTKE